MDNEAQFSWLTMATKTVWTVTPRCSLHYNFPAADLVQKFSIFMETKDPLPYCHTYFSVINFNIIFQYMCVGHLRCLFHATIRKFQVFTEAHTLLAKNNLNTWPCSITSDEWQASLLKLSMHTAETLSINLWCLKWPTILLFAVCNGFNVTFEHPKHTCALN